MIAIEITEFGGPEVLKIVEHAELRCGDDQVLIKVHAAGVNKPDVFQRKGNYPAPKDATANIPGLEVAGVVAEIGKNIQSLKVGDRIMALLSGGGYASYALAEEGNCIPIPSNLSFEQAASLPENLYTVWHNVFQRGKLTANDHFLVHGGSGGIGYTAIQLAKLFGAKVYTTVGSLEKEKFVRQYGADEVVIYSEHNFSDVWKDQIDLILDSIGGDYFESNISILREEGRLININAIHGGKVHVNLFKIMQKRITLSGSTLRSRDQYFKSLLTKELIKLVMPLVASNQFKIHIDRTFDLKDASLAHAYMERGEHLGKIILKI